jgi:alkanesulfonate monooxygenase SsuD/methylene tetrahydromethanopterin reductase-like flavin-dependent oxidoreductase (luciferase family)
MPTNTKFGVYAYNQAPWDEDHVQVCDRLVERGVRAEEKSFDDVFVIEHVGSGDYAYYEPLSVLSGIAERTSEIRLGTGIILAPFYHPVRLAQRAATIDVMSDGRLTLGFGTGYRENEFETFEIPYDERLPRTLETIDILKKLWRGNDVTHDGGRFHFEDLTVHPKPVQDGGPPIWLGLHGDWGLNHLANSEEEWWGIVLPEEQLQTKLGQYTEELEAAGTSIEESEIPIMIEASVAEDYETAVEAVREPVVEKYREYLSRAGPDVEGGKAGPHITNNPVLRNLDDPDDLTFDMIEDLFLIGGPEDVIEQIEDLREMGVNHFCIRPPLLQMDEDKVAQTIDIFGDEIIPYFREQEA